MDVYRLQASTVRAVLVTKERLIYGGISGINPTYIKVPKSTEAIVKTVEGDKIAYPGDWIVQIGVNSFMVFKHHVFKQLFSKI